MAKITEISVAQFQFSEGDAPATPASGVVKIYAKADGLLYSKDDAGTESPLVSAGDMAAATYDPTSVGGDAFDMDNMVAGDTNKLITATEKAKIITRSVAFYVDGTLAVEASAVSVIIPQALTITEIRAAVDTAPTGADLIVDINKNGTTIYTTQNNRPTIAADGTSATATDPDVTSLAVGDKLTLDIDQVGSTIAGANLSVVVICEVA